MINGRTTFTVGSGGAGGGGGGSGGFSWTGLPNNLNLAQLIGYSIATDIGATDLSFNESVSDSGFSISESTSLLTFTAPILVSLDPDAIFGGQISFISNPSLTTVSMPVLKTASYINFSVNNVLNQIDLTSLETVVSPGQLAFFENPLLESIDLSSLVSIFSGGELDIQGNTLLSTIDISNYVPLDGSGDVYSNNALSASTVNSILRRYVLNAAFVSGSVDLSGGTNAAPTGQGLADVAILTTRGVNVTTN